MEAVVPLLYIMLAQQKAKGNENKAKQQSSPSRTLTSTQSTGCMEIGFLPFLVPRDSERKDS